jgi:hypothetical protein
VSDEADIREKLRKIEALFARAGSEGERMAAMAAAERIRARLQQAQQTGRVIEMQFSLSNHWSRQLFIALCRRYGLEPFRYRRQRQTTVMLKAPEVFIHETLWPQYQKLNEVLTQYLSDITDRLIRDEVYAETGEAREVDGPAQLPGT